MCFVVWKMWGALSWMNGWGFGVGLLEAERRSVHAPLSLTFSSFPPKRRGRGGGVASWMWQLVLLPPERKNGGPGAYCPS